MNIISEEKNSRILALDYGTARIGVAISDPTQILASPLTTIENNAKSAKEIRKLIEENQVSTLVIGYPLNLKGKEEIAAEKVNAFIEKLALKHVEIVRWDERFSSVTAMNLLHEAGVKVRKDKGRIDRSAAAVILQNYLDSK